MSGDWQCGKTLAQCNQYMLEHEINTDVTFIIPKAGKHKTASDSVCCKAHKYMLVSRSPVFYAMLCGAMAEQGDIQVEDAKPEDFKKLLNYIYTDKINLLPTDVFDIWYLSKKYIIPRLTRKCIEYLHIYLTPDNTCLILDQSVIYEDKTLIEKCLKMIQAYTETTLKSKTMLNMRKETLMKILDCDVLSITETDVFNACVRWAKHQLVLKQLETSGENIRNVLGDCIRKIGYANMGLRKFSSIVAPLGILNPKEENAIFRYMSSKDVHHPPENFLCTKRDRIFPLAMIFSEQLLLAKKRLSDMNIKVTMTSKIDIEIQSVFVGCHRKINELHFDKNALDISSKLTIDDKMQEWKFEFPIILHKDQQHALAFTVLPYYKCDVYVVKRSEIVADDNIVEIQLKSSASFMPLLGFRYMLAIPE